jgi:hypothetical protein
MTRFSFLAKTIIEAMDHAWRRHCDVVHAGYQLDATRDGRFPDRGLARKEIPSIERAWFGWG